jgi:rhodanese-related sulfurtransferase
VGRTDLVAEHVTHDLARAQWASARSLGALAPETTLHPTHGFGSFCASSTEHATGSTVGDERRHNPALTTDRDTFVDALVEGFGPVPTYYEHMADLNRLAAGRHAARSARPLTRQQVTGALARGAWVVDLRARDSFAAGHVDGTVSVEYGHQFATYVGWLAPWGQELVLLADDLRSLAPALRDLAAIGIEGVGTHVLDPLVPGPASYRRTDWRGFREHPGDRVVVDVRQRDEYAAGHLPEAVHLPVQDVDARAATLPTGELWVHCRSGYRAGIAASLLARAGRSVVHVDDDWSRVAELAIRTTGGLAA